MSETGKRVVLLGKPGQAESRMQGMLADAGVDVALSLDPANSEPAQIAQAAPDAVVVLLEPGLEEALERFQGLLRDTALTVIYDEAELTLSRQGWDAARWMRHVLAKLHHHDDVLPPRQGEAGPQVSPEAVPAVPEQSAPLDAELLVDGSDVDWSSATTAIEFAADTVPAAEADGNPEAGNGLMSDADEFAWKPRDEQTANDTPEGLDELLRSLQADQVDELSEADPAVADAGMALAIDEPEPEAASEPSDDGSDGLSLVDFDTPAPVAVPTPASEPPSVAVSRDLDDLASRIAHLELVDEDDSPLPDHDETKAGVVEPQAEATREGAIWVLAGIGGPDAIRHLLTGLPAELDRPVLIQQKLEGARHDKLVQQLERISPVPVVLGSAGAALAAGTVHVLPGDIGVSVQDGADWRFDEHAPVLPALDAATASRSAVVVLSGADPAHVASAIDLASSGILLLAQSPETCFDAQGPASAIASGAHAVVPDQVAGILSSWAILGVRP